MRAMSILPPPAGGGGRDGPPSSIHVLHVDDDERILGLAARFLERGDLPVTTTGARNAEEGMGVLEAVGTGPFAEEGVDCVVSDYEMPGKDGLEFLREVRQRHPDLPLVLFTGRGDEAVASEAISVGITDYVRKAGPDPYATLTNRITNAVERRRTEARLEGASQRHRRVAEASADVAVAWDLDTQTVRWGDGFGETLGYDDTDAGRPFDWWIGRVHPDDRETVRDAVESASADGNDLEIRHRFRRADGSYATIVARGAPVADGARVVGALVDVTDRVERERKLAVLHDAMRSLLQAETETEAADAAVEAATSVLDLPAVVIRLFDEVENVLRPVARSPDADETLGEPVVSDPGGSLAWDVFVDGAAASYDDVRDAAVTTDADTAVRSALVLPLGEHGVVTTASTAVAAFDESTQDLASILAASTEAALDRIQRTSDLQQRDRQLHEKERRLDRLLLLNEAVRDVQNHVADADDPLAAKRYLCERLTALDRFAFAWVGDDDARPTAEVTAGDGAGYLDVVFGDDAVAPSDGDPLTADGPGAGRRAEPARECAATGSPEVVSTIGSGVQDSDWRRAALEAGFSSAMSVPLGYGNRQFGTLTVYADDSGAFGELARAALTDLGRTVARGVDAIETRRSLQADTAVELELRLSAPDDALQRLAREADTEVVLTGSVPSAEDTLRLFVTAGGTRPEAVRTAVAEVGGELVDVVGADDETLFELEVPGPGAVGWLADRGAVPVETTASPDALRSVVRIPGTVDVRSLVEAARSTFADATLLTRRDTDQPIGAGAVRTELFEDLTVRQREVLRTAYHSGYFEWPRHRSGEDVADTLDIAQPTFHRHLRKCNRSVYAALFEGHAGPNPSENH
jgi:PAS domain S-box-containing protein